MAKKKEPDFEENLQKLEEIALGLESGELKLEEAMRQYEDGVKLYRKCHEILRGAEKKVQMLVRDENGKLKAVAFEEEAATSADESRPEKGEAVQPAGSSKKKKGDTDLF